MSKRKETPSLLEQLQGLGRQPEQPAKAPKSPSKDRLAGRATYDIGEDLKEAIREESVRLGVPASMLAKYLLLCAWNDYVDGHLDPPTLLPSSSPAFRNVIDFGE